MWWRWFNYFHTCTTFIVLTPVGVCPIQADLNEVYYFSNRHRILIFRSFFRPQSFSFSVYYIGKYLLLSPSTVKDYFVRAPTDWPQIQFNRRFLSRFHESGWMELWKETKEINALRVYLRMMTHHSLMICSVLFAPFEIWQNIILVSMYFWSQLRHFRLYSPLSLKVIKIVVMN